jgi:hypothetical protein
MQRVARITQLSQGILRMAGCEAGYTTAGSDPRLRSRRIDDRSVREHPNAFPQRHATRQSAGVAATRATH